MSEKESGVRPSDRGRMLNSWLVVLLISDSMPMKTGKHNIPALLDSP